MTETYRTGELPMRSLKLLLPLAALTLLAGCASNRYLAKVGDEEITGDELLRVFSNQHTAMESAMGDERDVAKFLGKVVDRRLFVQEAYRIGLQESPAVLAGTRRYQQEQLARLVRERELSGAGTVTPAELKVAWALAQRSYLVRQFVAETREAAEAARARVVAGEELEAVARAGSSDTSAMHGGVQLVKWGGPDEELERVVFGLELDQLSPVFRSEAGWQFLRVEKAIAPEGAALAKALADAEGTVARRKTALREAALRERLSARYGLQLLDCPADMAGLKKAADSGEGPACATWKGGALKLPEIAKAMNLEKAGNAPPDKVRHVYEITRRSLLDTVLCGLEGEARGWGALPEIAGPVQFRRETLMEEELYSQYVFQGVTVSDAETRTYFETHPTDFARPAVLGLAQILVEKEEEATALRARLVAGASFEELAREASKDAQSAARGGAIGPATAPQLQGPFAPVATLEAGELSRPIHSKYGWHLIKVLTRTPSTQPGLEEVQKEAGEKALQAKLAAVYDGWVERLKKATRVTQSEAGLHAFAERRMADAAARETDLNARQVEKQKRIEAVQKEVEAVTKAREAEKAAREPPKDGPGAPPAAAAPGPGTSAATSVAPSAAPPVAPSAAPGK
jgi:parvulin-like peptidyl-prolyl isomerase